MDDLTGSHILLTQAFLSSLAGSEMVTLELAEHFAGRGAGIIVATHFASDPMLSLLNQIPNLELFSTDDPALNERLLQVDLALAWLHHQIIPEPILRGVIRCAVVFNHMSSAHPMEYCTMPDIEGPLASAVLFNSPETLELQRASGLLNEFPEERLRVFPNPAPDSFADIAHELNLPKPRLLVVSNHIPPEVSEAIERIDGHFDTTIIGRGGPNGGTPERIRPEHFANTHAVLSIGKTVQYGLVSATPVYCYDHFGGPGWLRQENFDVARHHNFSGRGFGSKSAEEIATELSGGFDSAAAAARTLRNKALPEFLLSQQIRELEGAIEMTPSKPTPLREGQILAHLKMQELLGHRVRDWLVGRAREEALEESRGAIRKSEESLHMRYDAMRESYKDLNTQNAELLESVAALEETAATQLQEAIAAGATKAASLEEQLRKLNEAFAHNNSQRTQLQRDLDALHRTLSWRVTRPLRSVHQFIQDMRITRSR